MISQCIFLIFLKFWFLGCYGGKWAKISPKWKNNYICHTPCLRNSMAFDHNFWYTFASVFLSLFIFWAVKEGGGGGGRGKGEPKIKSNNYICHALYLRNSIACDHDFWYICVKWWHLQVFFPLFWNFHFSSC